MRKKLINSQLTNMKTYLMYRQEMLTLAENVFEFKNLPEFIDVSYLNKTDSSRAMPEKHVHTTLYGIQHMHIWTLPSHLVSMSCHLTGDAWEKVKYIWSQV